MPIQVYLAGRPFALELIHNMSVAFGSVLRCACRFGENRIVLGQQIRNGFDLAVKTPRPGDDTPKVLDRGKCVTR
jgi:hypothetical protein